MKKNTQFTILVIAINFMYVILSSTAVQAQVNDNSLKTNHIAKSINRFISSGFLDYNEYRKKIMSLDKLKTYCPGVSVTHKIHKNLSDRFRKNSLDSYIECARLPINNASEHPRKKRTIIINGGATKGKLKDCNSNVLALEDFEVNIDNRVRVNVEGPILIGDDIFADTISCEYPHFDIGINTVIESPRKSDVANWYSPAHWRNRLQKKVENTFEEFGVFPSRKIRKTSSTQKSSSTCEGLSLSWDEWVTWKIIMEPKLKKDPSLSEEVNLRLNKYCEALKSSNDLGRYNLEISKLKQDYLGIPTCSLASKINQMSPYVLHPFHKDKVCAKTANLFSSVTGGLTESPMEMRVVIDPFIDQAGGRKRAQSLIKDASVPLMPEHVLKIIVNTDQRRILLFMCKLTRLNTTDNIAHCGDSEVKTSKTHINDKGFRVSSRVERNNLAIIDYSDKNDIATILNDKSFLKKLDYKLYSLIIETKKNNKRSMERHISEKAQLDIDEVRRFVVPEIKKYSYFRFDMPSPLRLTDIFRDMQESDRIKYLTELSILIELEKNKYADFDTKYEFLQRMSHTSSLIKKRANFWNDLIKERARFNKILKRTIENDLSNAEALIKELKSIYYVSNYYDQNNEDERQIAWGNLRAQLNSSTTDLYIKIVALETYLKTNYEPDFKDIHPYSVKDIQQVVKNSNQQDLGEIIKTYQLDEEFQSKIRNASKRRRDRIKKIEDRLELFKKYKKGLSYRLTVLNRLIDLKINYDHYEKLSSLFLKVDVEWVKIPFHIRSKSLETVFAEQSLKFDGTTYSRGFLIAKNKMTVQQYLVCVSKDKEKGCTLPLYYLKKCNVNNPGREDLAMNCVTWSQARTFSKWIGGDLPTYTQQLLWESIYPEEKPLHEDNSYTWLFNEFVIRTNRPENYPHSRDAHYLDHSFIEKSNACTKRCIDRPDILRVAYGNKFKGVSEKVMLGFDSKAANYKFRSVVPLY